MKDALQQTDDDRRIVDRGVLEQAVYRAFSYGGLRRRPHAHHQKKEQVLPILTADWFVGELGDDRANVRMHAPLGGAALYELA